MAKFDESKVINGLHTERAEVGKKYWFAPNISELKYYVETDATHRVSELKDIESKFCPFLSKDFFLESPLIYPYEEPPKERMTNRQLAEWLAKGNGQTSGSDWHDAYLTHTYDKNRDDNEVMQEIEIRPWGSDEWVEPTVDIYERDCK